MERLLPEDPPANVENMRAARADPLPMGASFTVHRGRLVRDLVAQGGRAGIVVVYAPRGFGKTALALQYVEEIRTDPARGWAQMVEAEGALAEELAIQLDEIEQTAPLAMRPFVAIENVPCLLPGEAAVFVERLRDMRSRGFEFLLTCEPSNRELVRLLGDSVKINAQKLKVQPREYSDWARIYTISNQLDIYALTQGVPSLVAALQASVERVEGTESLLESAIVDMYGSMLVDLADSNRHLLKLVCLMLLVGEGSVAELERCGVGAQVEELAALLRDYPAFGYEPAERTFSCLGCEDDARARVREMALALYPGLEARAARVHMRAGRVDRAVALAERFMDENGARGLIAQFPLAIVLAGHASFVRAAVAPLVDSGAGFEGNLGLLVAYHAASLISGNLRAARGSARILRMQAEKIPNEVGERDWQELIALNGVWSSCRGIELPDVAYRQEGEHTSLAVRALKAHAWAERDLVGASGLTEALDALPACLPSANEIEIPHVLLQMDRLLAEVFDGSFEGVDERDRMLAELEPVLRRRRLSPVLDRLRMVVSARRLFSGVPVVDERAFVDAGNAAIRTSETDLQLLCMLLEGWNAVGLGQAVNARFRAQQVLKLASEQATLLRDCAELLEKTAMLICTSRVAVKEEAELLDLAEGSVGSACAWCTALHLSQARYDSELAAWYSMHKRELLDARLRSFARKAIHDLGTGADSLRRLLPAEMRESYALDEDVKAPSVLESMLDEHESPELGVVSLSLFGGFTAERNGHVVTDARWQRKKCTVLAARLALAQGSFVTRKILTEELWPKAVYTRAREYLYVSLSSLRGALGQVTGGPCYVLVQGDGVALNTEYVTSDVSQFERLARTILLKRSGVSSPQLVELCLKMEQLYRGPLFVPNSGDADYFVSMRRRLQNKFVDCMVRGINAAIEEEDITSAAWLVEAALKQEPTREDLVRAAMMVYDLGGRRREVVELYTSHLNVLEREAQSLPDPETRKSYEAIIDRVKQRGII